MRDRVGGRLDRRAATLVATFVGQGCLAEEFCQPPGAALGGSHGPGAGAKRGGQRGIDAGSDRAVRHRDLVGSRYVGSEGAQTGRDTCVDTPEGAHNVGVNRERFNHHVPPLCSGRF